MTDDARVQKRLWQCLRWWEEVFVPTPVLIDVIWGDDENGGPENPNDCLAHAAVQLRRRVYEHGYYLPWAYKLGYSLVQMERAHHIFPSFNPITQRVGTAEAEVKAMMPTAAVIGLAKNIPACKRYLSKEST